MGPSDVTNGAELMPSPTKPPEWALPTGETSDAVSTSCQTDGSLRPGFGVI
jgi:hypothetical protein